MWDNKKASAPQQLNEVGFAVDWFEQRLEEVKKEVDVMMQQFRLSEALKTIYSLVWDDFCSWYLEWVKPGFEQSIDEQVYQKTIHYFEQLMELLHPFVPFITEEIYQLLQPQNTSLCVKQQNKSALTLNVELLQLGQTLKLAISSVRDVRNKQQLKPKDTIDLFVQTSNVLGFERTKNILSKQVNARSFEFATDAIDTSLVTVVENDTFYVVTDKQVDETLQKDDLLKELAYQQNFLQSVFKKLSNERFVQNAKPEVVELERKKQSDAEQRIQTIQETLAKMNG
jgi:valyl-tRNA synthetase